jgi:hypothetical protein
MRVLVFCILEMAKRFAVVVLLLVVLTQEASDISKNKK